MIFGFVQKDSGPGFHRIMMPLLMMQGIDVHITNTIEELDFAAKGPNAIYYNRYTDDRVIGYAKKYGCKIVVDVDDYWRLDPHHIAYNDYIKNNFEALQIKHLQLADVVTTTHYRLAEKIKPYNSNIVILPNAIPQHDYFPTSRTESERVRIFWQGSITHAPDIDLLRNPFKRLDGNKYHMVLAGYMQANPAWDRMIAAYTNGLRLKGSILPGLPPHEYYSNYQYADICVAPLLDTSFNSMKSNLKILEAAHMGIPVIASHVHPYLNLPMLYAHYQSDWFKQIHHLRDESTRKQLGELLRDYCKKNFNYEIINLKRKECFK